MCRQLSSSADCADLPSRAPLIYSWLLPTALSWLQYGFVVTGAGFGEAAYGDVHGAAQQRPTRAANPGIAAAGQRKPSNSAAADRKWPDKGE